AIYKAYHMPERLSSDYYAVDLLNDTLGGSKSSRFYEQLVKKKPYFNTISTHVTASFDPGLLVMRGRLNDNITFEEAEAAIQEIIDELQTKEVKEPVLEKVKNQTEAHLVFSEVDLLHRAQELAMAALLGDPNLVNHEVEKISAVTTKDIKNMAQKVLRPTNASTIYYKRKK
ncbi:MAG: insulinase family protein, partial [Cytophagales bacterium]|nr:insulinase family protein [Cytophagales bacterium]